MKRLVAGAVDGAVFAVSAGFAKPPKEVVGAVVFVPKKGAVVVPVGAGLGLLT